MLYRVRKTKRRDRRRGGRTPWVLRWHDPPGGRRLRQQDIGSMSERMAERCREALQAQLNGVAPGTDDAGGPTWPDFRDGYLAAAAADLKPATVAIYRQVLARFEAAVAPRVLAGVDRRLVETYRIGRLGKVSQETARKDVRHLRAAFAWAVNLKMMESNPCVGIRFGRRETFDPDAMTEAETDRFLVALEARSTWVQASLRIACLWGPRAGELARLERADVDLAGRRIRIAAEPGRGTPKTGRGRTIPLDEESAGLLQELWHRDEPILWGPLGAPLRSSRGMGGYTRTLGAECRAVLATIGVHARDDKPLQFLRRTAETNLRRRGVPDWMIGAILGHGTRVGEQWYDGIGPAELADRVAALRLGPRTGGLNV